MDDNAEKALQYYEDVIEPRETLVAEAEEDAEAERLEDERLYGEEND